MSTTIDPAKATPFNPLLATPLAKAKDSEKKPSLDLDAAPKGGPAPDLAAFVANASAPKPLGGPGVATTVFSTSPNPKTMSDQQLTAGITKLGAAIKASPGKATEHDLRLYGSMMLEAANRAALAGAKVEPSKMDNQQLFGALVAFDTMKASGQKLTKEQEATYANLQKVWKERTTIAPEKVMKELLARRAQLEKDMAAYCSGMIGAATGVMSHPVGVVTGVGLTGYALSQGRYGDALQEALLVGLSFSPAHLAADAWSTTANTLHCTHASDMYLFNEKAIAAQKAKVTP